jgi:hypothetical protein
MGTFLFKGGRDMELELGDAITAINELNQKKTA